jgi:hypothetical protein
VKEVAMTVFLSYAHQDVASVGTLRQDLLDMGQSVWFDESLHGGQIWWDEILRQVRECQVFVLAVSVHSLESEACMAEWAYAMELNRPFLPVRIDQTDWTTAPEKMRQSQHIEYTSGTAESAKALAKALHSVPASVPLPEVLPTPPPTPLSYHERYAKLFAPEPLHVDDQIAYFVRLTLDVESANTVDALQLLQVLRNRDDLSWKVRERIDQFLAERAAATTVTTPPKDEDVDALAPVPDDGGDDSDEVVPPLPWWRRKGAKWALGGVAAIVVLIVGLSIFLPEDSPPPEPPHTENTLCDADTCDSTPIRFVDLARGSDELTAKLVDPQGAEVQRVDPPSATGDSTAEWTWYAELDDPIGEYTVQFTSATTQPVEHTFTVEPEKGIFGVVQRTADAIRAQDWDQVATLDKRIADELEQNGPAFLDDQYPASVEKHWLPYDQSGQTNASGTTIIGAYIAYSEADDTTTAYCELWSISPNGKTMRSGPLPVEGTQVKLSLTGREAPGNFSGWISEKCVSAAEPTTG